MQRVVAETDVMPRSEPYLLPTASRCTMILVQEHCCKSDNVAGGTGLEPKSPREPQRTNSRRIAFQIGERARGSQPFKSFVAASDVGPGDSQLHRSLGNPTFHPTDHSDTIGKKFCDSRMIPTPPDASDHMIPSFNPRVPGSRPGRPTRIRVWRVV
jgi:hypothetical protein